MRIPRLILTVGLPRCGKSTWAAAQGLPVVNPDAIRVELHGMAHDSAAESMVWHIARHRVEQLFTAGHPVVILDATNLTRSRRDEWLSSAWECVYKCFPTPLEECLRRAASSPNRLLPAVIAAMASRIEWP